MTFDDYYRAPQAVSTQDDEFADGEEPKIPDAEQRD